MIENKIKSRRRALFVEVVLTICIAVLVISSSIANVNSLAEQYSKDLETNYNSVVDNYITEFKLMTIMSIEQVNKDLTFDEMTEWMQQKEEGLGWSIGTDVYDGFAMTYKGGFIHSWNYGDYSDYDPTSRPWYQAAEEADGNIAIVAPYVTYLDSDETGIADNILMTIAQKYNDDIYFYYDIKIEQIRALLQEMNFTYSDMKVLLIDNDGYVLSSTNDDLYAHNVNEVDDVVTEDTKQVMTTLDTKNNKTHLEDLDGVKVFVYAVKDNNGNTIIIGTPFMDVFLHNILPVLLAALLLIIVEVLIYRRTNRSIQELHDMDTRLSAITTASFELQATIDVDSMIVTLDESGTRKPYQEFYDECVKNVVNTIEADKANAFMSPEAIKQLPPGDQMRTEKIQVYEQDDAGKTVTRTREMLLLVSLINRKKIVTLLSNDVTEREYLQKQILQSIASRYDAAFVCSEDTGEYEIISEGPKYARIIDGIRPYELIIETIANDFIKPEYKEAYFDAVDLEKVHQHLEKHHTFDVTVQLNNEHWISIYFIRCLDYMNNHLFIQCVEDANDQMEQKELLRSALNHAQIATKAKTDFLSRMSHDMRTPMNGILGLAALMKDKTDINDIQEDLEQLESSGHYLLSLINDTLDMSKIEAGKMELRPKPTDAKRVANSIISNVKILAKDKNQVLHMELSENETWSPVVIDAARIEQVMMNLISNAVKYTPENGEITVRMETLSKDNHQITNRFTIKDNGIGMSEGFVAHIFEPFSQEGRTNTERQNGTGLGMSIVKQLVDLMNGEIEIHSKLNEGTEAIVTLSYPVYEGVLQPENDGAVSLEYLKGAHVLLCEDNALNAQIASRLLDKVGVITDIAVNGAEGVDTFFTASPGFYDAILMDLQMPVMNGIEATRTIREMNKPEAVRIPIIAMTANAFGDDVEECMMAGMNAHLAKPVEPQMLYETLAKFIR